MIIPVELMYFVMLVTHSVNVQFIVTLKRQFIQNDSSSQLFICLLHTMHDLTNPSRNPTNNYSRPNRRNSTTRTRLAAFVYLQKIKTYTNVMKGVGGVRHSMYLMATPKVVTVLHMRQHSGTECHLNGFCKVTEYLGSLNE